MGKGKSLSKTTTDRLNIYIGTKEPSLLQTHQGERGEEEKKKRGYRRLCLP